jgi:AtzE family amidohydrolase
MTAGAIAAAVAGRDTSARAVVSAALDAIDRADTLINAFTHVDRAAALEKADALDLRLAAGSSGGRLAGVPFAVKNLVDLRGVPTLAGSKINRDANPATDDALIVRRLEAAGAICVGALNMGEYAYDFTGENSHFGASRNPHDVTRMSGGSSGGSGAAVAAGMVPISVGSDTNGSIRVPSSFCGVFGLKPTFGRLSREGCFPFVDSLDHIGLFARSTSDLVLGYTAALDPEGDGPSAMPSPNLLASTISGLRVAVADGYFAREPGSDAQRAVRRVADTLGCETTVTLPHAAEARAAAYLITAAEGAALHLDRLRERPGDFDPAVRDRLLAGAMIPAAWVVRAQKFRHFYREKVLRLFETVDAILLPATPCRALALGQKSFAFEGASLPARANIGLYTQPISFIGLPVVAVPVWLDDGLPIAVQIVTAPWREDQALRIAGALEAAGVVAAPVARAIGAAETP